MFKWDLPKPPTPSWLDPKCEITHDPPKLPPNMWTVESMETCLTLGCDPVEASGVVANAMNESARGQSFRAYNYGGWKCGPNAAMAYKLAHDGAAIPFWSAPGNKAPGATPGDLKGGDPIYCYYRAFLSSEDYYRNWLEHFVPEPGAHTPYPGYKHCGELFWQGAEWFPELIKVGYKGTNTQKHPEGAIQEHRSLCSEAKVLWTQSRLGVEVDGKVGPKTLVALADLGFFVLNNDTLRRLAIRTIKA